MKSRWLSLFLCGIATTFSLYFLLQQSWRNNVLIYNQNNFHFGEKIGRKIAVPKSFHHSAAQEKRLKHLEEFCVANSDSYGISSLIRFIRSGNENKAHLYISKAKKIVYCSVPKVASTNWKRLLLLFEGTITKETDADLKKEVHTFRQDRLFQQISKQEIKKMLFYYYKFLFVRHPFERLASAYRNKFVENNIYFRTTYGSQILRLYRQNLTEREYSQGRGVTFTEFIKWLLSERVFDAHWAPIENLCHPCVLPYSFIGKMDSLLEDAEQVLKDIGTNEHFPTNKTDGHKVSSRKLMYQYFTQLSPEIIDKVYERYKVDFLAFDYRIPEKILNQTQYRKYINTPA